MTVGAPPRSSVPTKTREVVSPISKWLGGAGIGTFCCHLGAARERELPMIAYPPTPQQVSEEGLGARDCILRGRAQQPGQSWAAGIHWTDNFGPQRLSPADQQCWQEQPALRRCTGEIISTFQGSPKPAVVGGLGAFRRSQLLFVCLFLNKSLCTGGKGLLQI